MLVKEMTLKYKNMTRASVGRHKRCLFDFHHIFLPLLCSQVKILWTESEICAVPKVPPALSITKMNSYFMG